MIFEPIEALRAWRAQFGPTFLVNQLGTRVVVTADPKLVREIYEVDDPELYAAVLPSTVAVLFGEESLLLNAGAEHRRKRKLLMRPFCGPRIREWGETIADAGRRSFTVDREIRALDLAQQATLEVIIRVVFGVEDPGRVASFTAAVLAWTNALRPGFLFVRALQTPMFGLSPYARYARAWARVDALLLDQIARTRALVADDPTRGDVLSSLVAARYDDGTAMTDSSIRDQLRTLLYAGYETSAIILTWALYFVLRDRELHDRLLAEIAGESDPDVLARLPLLGAVIDETLRMRPVTPDPVRVLAKPAQFGGWSLPAGMSIAPAPTLLHHDPELWDEPERFRPERFLGAPPSPHVYIPFGGGGRRCLGAGFARFEASILLATLLREFEFELLDHDVAWERALATLQPLGGVRMRVRAHRVTG